MTAFHRMTDPSMEQYFQATAILGTSSYPTPNECYHRKKQALPGVFLTEEKTFFPTGYKGLFSSMSGMGYSYIPQYYFYWEFHSTVSVRSHIYQPL